MAEGHQSRPSSFEGVGFVFLDEGQSGIDAL
jgi:hypothetical protein